MIWIRYFKFMEWCELLQLTVDAGKSDKVIERNNVSRPVIIIGGYNEADRLAG